MIRDVVGWLFLAGLGLAPLIFGANVALAWGINAAVFGFLLAIYAFHHIVSGRPWPVPFSRFALPGASFALVLLWIAVQAQPWVPGALEADAWPRASELLGATVPGSISVNPDATLLGLLRLATAGAVFLLALQLGRDGHWASRIVGALAVAGSVHAVYAMALAASGPGTSAALLPPALFKLSQAPYLTGTFINRNHFAIYLGLALVSTWGLLLRDLRVSMSDHGLPGPRELIAKGLGLAGDLARYGVLLMPLTVALLLTGSRAGFFLTVASLLVIVVVERRGSHRSTLAMKAALAVALAGMVLALLTRGDLFGERLSQTGADDVESRLAVARITLRAIADEPLTGFGYGTFADVFPLYRDDSIPVIGKWREAHNSYLEALLGLGIPMAGVLFLCLGLLVAGCLGGALHRKRHRLAPTVAVGASLIVGWHALVDFSIQLQGIALGYAALLGAGFAQSWSSRQA
jgi:O-antigen ligase